MNGKVRIKGDVGVAVNAEEGSAVHIHVVETDEKKELINWAVYTLLRTCEEADCRQALESISQSLFGSALFKRLSLDQLKALQVIANEFSRCSQQEQADSHALFSQEMDEYEDFYRRTGIRASKTERKALISLITEHPFNAQQVKLAWNNNTLSYQNDKLCTRSERLQCGLGVFVALLSCILLTAFFLALIFKGPGILSLKLVGQQCVLGATLWVAVRYMVAPTLLAKRIVRTLHRNRGESKSAVESKG